MWARLAVILSPRYGHLILVSGYRVLTGVYWSQHGCPMSNKYMVNQRCMSRVWRMAAMLGNSAVIVVVRTRLQAIPLAMTTMRKSTHGFSFPMMSMGLRLAAFGPPELRFKFRRNSFPNNAGMKNPTDLNFGEVVCLSIIYLILDLIYWMVTISIFDANHQFVDVRDLSEAFAFFSRLLSQPFPIFI